MGKKKLLIFAASAVIVVTAVLGICKLLPVKNLDKQNSRNISDVSPLLKNAVLLEKLTPDKSKKAEEKLMEFSARDDALGYFAALELADRYSSRGQEAVSYYRRALELYDTMEVRKRLAAQLAKNGQYTDAADIYASVLPDEASLEALLNLPVSPDAVGKVLIKYKQWQAAEDFLKSEIEKVTDSTVIIELGKIYANVLVEMARYKQALTVIEGLPAVDSGDSNMKWLYARSLEGVGQTKKAKDVYKSIGEMGAYRLGLILEKEGNLKDAAAAFTSSSENDSLWKGARLFDEMGNYGKALEVYIKLSRGQGVYQDDAAYRSYVLLDRNKMPQANEMLSILSKYPAWMMRLNKEPSWDTLADLAYSKPEFLDRVDAYKMSGRSLMAQVEMAIGENNADTSGKLALGDWYLSRGDYYQAAKWGMKALKEQPLRHGYELAYQKPYDEHVKKAASEFNIDPYLLWALMREESYYKQDAVSRVGALGLMQIMPETGKFIASKLKTEFKQEELLEPEVNIRFSAYYLKSLLNTFSGDIDKALASYNGGSGNVKKWSMSNIGASKNGFPTAVLYSETREYITKVRNSYHIYKMLYEKQVLGSF